jgi:acetylornithine/succinyldiaminopimelate/putrescine aminotransferase
MVFSKGEGAHIVDPEGNKYIDFLSAYSAVNQVVFFTANYFFAFHLCKRSKSMTHVCKLFVVETNGDLELLVVIHCLADFVLRTK